jgi:hypothetical protein
VSISAPLGVAATIRLVWVGLVAANALASLAFGQEPAAAVRFSAADRVLLGEYRLLERDAPLILALHPKRTAAAAAALKKQGARVIGRRDSIGYLFAIVPIDAAAAVLELDGLQALQVTANPMRAMMMSDTSQTALAVQSRPSRPRGAPPSPSLTADNPFTGEAATQALAFKAEHPEFDGRGVITAFVEPIAPHLMTMRGALDASGRELPKFSRYDLRVPELAAEPIADGLNIWQHTEQVRPDDRGVFNWRGRTYRLPIDVASSRRGATQWRMCRRLPARYDTSKEQYDVLWAVDQDRVWVLPVSAGSDFSEARSALLKGPVSWIEIEDRAGRRIDPTNDAFVFKSDRERYWLGFSPSGIWHAGMVGSVMAGTAFLGSQAHGVAPAAQISIFHGTLTVGAPGHTGIEQMLAMLTDPRVDVAEASYLVSDTSRFGDRPVHASWMERLASTEGKPFIVAAGNFGPNLFGSHAFAMAKEVFAVGAYTPRATWLANLGIAPASEHTLWSLSGYGPARDGGLKPDFLALTQTLSQGGLRWYWADTPGFEDYAVSGGTSASAPHGAGHVALLVSAAKQTRVPHDVPRLRAAIATSAKFLEGVEARAQGHGLIQVRDAWAALQRANAWTPPSFTIQASLVGAESKTGGPEKFLGRGLFELSGWRPGQKGQRELIMARTGGPIGSNRYLLRWKGDTRAFSSELSEIALPLGKAVAIPVEIEVGASGAYSAILDLIDPTVDLVAASVLSTILVADPLPAHTEGLHYARQSPRPGNSLFYVDVPPGLAALTVKLTKDGGKSVWSAQDPTGRSLPFSPYGSEIWQPAPLDLESQEQHFSYGDPVPGVWQFRVWNSEPQSMQDLDAVDWTRPMPIDVQIQGWAATAGPAVPAQSAGSPTDVQFQNHGAVFEASIEAIGLGATRDAEVTLRPGLDPTSFDVLVEPGTRRIEMQFEHAAADAQVGLYVYKVPEGERRHTTLSTDHTALIYYDSSFQPRKRHVIETPPPGRYRITLDPIRVPPAGVRVAWRDTVYHPMYGSVEVADTRSLLPAGDSKKARARAVVRARPSDDRELLAEVALFNHITAEKKFPVAIQTWIVSK